MSIASPCKYTNKKQNVPEKKENYHPAARFVPRAPKREAQVEYAFEYLDLYPDVDDSGRPILYTVDEKSYSPKKDVARCAQKPKGQAQVEYSFEILDHQCPDVDHSGRPIVYTVEEELYSTKKNLLEVAEFLFPNQDPAQQSDHTPFTIHKKRKIRSSGL